MKQNSRIALISALLLALISTGFAQPAGDSTIFPRFATYWNPWAPALMAGLMLGVGIIAFSWMYASLVMDDKLKTWCKREMVQLGFTVIIVVAAIGLVGVMSQYMMMIASVTPPASSAPDAQSWQNYVALRCNTPAARPELDRPCHIRLAEDYLQILASSQQAEGASVLRYYAFLATISSIQIDSKGMYDPAGQLTIEPFGALSTPVETLAFTFDIAGKNLMVIRAQQYVVDFLHVAFFPLFFTMGLFFRSLYFTRRLGGLLIAIALGFYLVYPLMYVFFHSVLFSVGSLGRFQSGLTPEAIGQQLYPIDVNLTGVTMPPVQVVSHAGSSCGNYSVEAGEECNEPGLSCPPLDANSGLPLPGRGSDFYCNTNTCICTSDRYGGLSANFRDPNNGFVEEVSAPDGSRQTVISNSAKLTAAICAENPSDEQKSEVRNMFAAEEKTWYEKLYDGYVHGFYIALGKDELIGFNGVIDNLAKILIFSLVSPFIAIMVALASVKALSPMLGGDVEIAGLTRII